MAYAVIRTDLMTGTNVGAGLVSLRYCTGERDSYTPAEVENGSVVKLVQLEADNREVWTATDVAANDKISDVAIVASVETLYDERKKNLDEFVNEAGAISRGYRPHSGDVFSVTSEAFADGDNGVEVGHVVELAEGHKLKAVSEATGGSTPFGKIIAIEETNRYKYFVIKVD